MCDRGRIQEAVKKDGSKIVSLRYTYIVMSSATLAVLESSLVMRCELQSTETEVDYNEALTAIWANFGDDVATYSNDIDSFKWTVFANMLIQASAHGEYTISSKITSDNTNRFTRMRPQDNNTPRMTSCPLFRWRTTNVIEEKLTLRLKWTPTRPWLLMLRVT